MARTPTDGPAARRGQGFAPSELSAMVHERVVGEHADGAAFLWMARDRATRGPHYGLADLQALDERLQAQLCGLHIAHEAGWRHCEGRLASCGPGELFAACAVAYGAGERAWMRDTLLLASAAPGLDRALVSALAWLPHADVAPWIDRLVASVVPQHRAIGLAASAAHGVDPGPALARALDDEAPTCRRRALRAVGELGCVHAAPRVRAALEDPDPACAYWAARSLTLLGEHDGAHALYRIAWQGGAFANQALHEALQVFPLPQGRDLVRSLVARPGSAALAIAAVGSVGDAQAIPWLLRQMHEGAHRRLAGAAFSMVTGCDLARESLDQDAPAPVGVDGPDDAQDAPDSPMPDAERVSAWWRDRRQEMAPGVRHLNGRPAEAANLLQTLSGARQPQRAAAAFQLACRRPTAPLFNVRARGDLQARRVAAWSS